MKRFIISFLLVFVLALPSHAIVFRAFTSLTGEISGSVDNTDCADIGDGAEDAGGVVTLLTGEVYFYYFDQSATNATSSPTYIRCKNYVASGVWIKLALPDNDIDSDHYTDGSIDEAHLNIANAPTDEYVLTYESDTTNFQWVELAGGGDITTVGTCVTGDCTDDFVDGTDIADDAIDSEHYTDGSIDKGHLAADVIDETKLEDNSIDSEHYNDDSIDEPHLNVSNAPTDNYILSYNLAGTNFTWVAAGAGDITNVGDCTDGECTDDFIDGTDIVDEAIDSEHYADGSIDEIHLDISNEPVDEYVLTYEADTTNFQWVAAGTGDITNVGECASGECTADFINGTDIVDASISDEHLDAVAGPTDEYVLTWEDDTGQFEWAELAGGGDITTVGTCVTGDCTDDFINGTDIADGAIDSEHYTALSIDKGHLAADVIDETKLEDDSLDSEHYNDASVDEVHVNIQEAPTDEYILTYEADTTNFSWQQTLTVPQGGTGAATLNDGGLLVGAGTGAVEVLADGLATEILVGGGADTNPGWGTDIPTAVTIGTAYIYRVGGTDVADSDVADDITASNYLPLAGGTLTGDTKFDDDTTDSPALAFYDATEEYFSIFKIDGGSLNIYSNTDNRNVAINSDVGSAHLTVDGTISEGGTSLVSKYLALATGGTLEGSVYFDDGDANSPGARFIDETDEYWHLYKIDASNLHLYTTHADDQTFQISNEGAGEANVTVDGFVESDLYKRFNTSKPPGAEIDQVYGADGVTWNPTSGDILVNHYVKYVEPPAAECLGNGNPHVCCTDVATGATCEETWILTEGPDGTQYFSGIGIATSTYGSGDSPVTLSASEVLGGIIYVTSGPTRLVVPSVLTNTDYNFTVITVGTGVASIDPNIIDLIVLDGATTLDVGDQIDSTATTGDIAVCTYYSADGLYCTTNGWSDGGAP